MGSTDAASTLLESLPARPPTPPRESRPDSQAELKPLLARRPADPRSNLSTPPSVHSPALSSQGSSSRRKKVEFSAQAEYKEPPTFPDGRAVRQNPTPVSAPSSTTSRPIKSILKVTHGPSLLDPCERSGLHGDEAEAVNIVAMLDSTIKQLRGADRSSKRDAYVMLVRALKTSDNLPDRIALKGQMDHFMEFLQRDITLRTPSGHLDSGLVNQALTLLIAFLHLPKIAETLTIEFCVFVVDHCTKSFQDPTTPKDVARHLMQVVASLNLAKLMTAERVRCLVTALHKIEDHLTGKSIIMSRILIYRQLVRQCKPLMAKYSDWVLDLLTDMLSGMREIRSAAVSLGLEAAYSLGKEKSLSARVMETFKLAPKGETYIDFYTAKLKAMTGDKEQIQFVPQIWSVVVLLVRDFDRWEYFNPWLAIIQDCFNSRDYHTRHEANFAWNRLVYRLYLDARPLPKAAPTLSGALASQLKRRSTGKAADDLRRVVLGGVCNLFYYAFPPNVDMKHVDTYWDDALNPIVQRLTTRQPEDRREHLEHASAILTGLFDCYTQRLWVHDRIATAALVKPQELPPIDPKWLRRNAKRVLNTVGPILEQSFPELSRLQSATHKLWKTLVGAVASAASKEVKVSQDTASFMAAVFGLMAKIWTAGSPEPKTPGDADSQAFLDSMQEFVGVCVSSLGVLPFTETKLSWDKQSTFEPLDTPSHRSAKVRGNPRSALQHLFSILSSLPPRVSDDHAFARFLRSVFAPFFDVKNEKGQMELALEMMHLTPAEVLCPVGTWLVVAERIKAPFDQLPSSHHTSTSSNDTPVGHEYREAVKVLDRGLRYVPSLPWEDWQKLFHVLSARVREETGGPGLAICVIEPLAKSILELQSRPSPTRSSATLELLRYAAHPRDRPALDSARRRLWGTSIAGSRTASFDPFDHLYKLVTASLRSLYRDLAAAGVDDLAASLLREVGEFLSRSSVDLYLGTLAAVQDGVAVWIQDEDTLLSSRQSTAVAEATKNLWDQISIRLGQTGRVEDLPLASIETLLCAAFESKHRHVVNSVSTLWNGLYDGAENVSYPERLRAILLARRSFVDLVLPGLEGSSLESGAQQPAFIDSQEDMNMLTRGSTKTGAGTPSRPSSVGPRSPHLVVLGRSPIPRPTSTPASGVRRPASRSSGPRLRHDNSQLHFVAVGVAQEEDAGESQVLTDRQREVRERQRETTALFPEIRSSPAAKARPSAGSPTRLPVPVFSPEKLPEQLRAATPDAERVLDDYIACTPTPRRGHALPMPDNDPPSSPPDAELRRNPLLSEISSRSEKKTMNWEEMVASSPASSPVAPQAPARVPSPVLDLDEDAAEGEAQSLAFVDAPVFQSSQLPDSFADARMDVGAENDESAAPVDIGAPSAKAKTRAQRSAAQTGPKRQLRSTASQEALKPGLEIPKETRATPARPRASKRASTRARRSSGISSQAEDESFVASEIDEQSLLRLGLELDGDKPPSPSTTGVVNEVPPSAAARELDVKPARPLVTEPVRSPVVESAPSPAGRRAHTPVVDRAHDPVIEPPCTPVLDCIMVKEWPSTDESSLAETSASSSREATGSSRRNKRKRPLAAVDESEGSRKHRRRSEEVDLVQVPDSQVSPDAQKRLDDFSVEDVETPAEAKGAETIGGEQLLDGDVQSQSEHVENDIAEVPSSLVEGDAMEVERTDESTDEDEALHSQLALDEEADNQRKAREEADIQPQAPAAEALATMEGADAVQGEPAGGGDELMGGSVEDIMKMLRGGLDALRAANLARDEVHKVEDLCMDIKRELYEAERRGRR